MNDDQKFPFELPTGDESPAQNPPMASSNVPPRSSPPPPPVRPAVPPAGGSKPDVKIATGAAAPSGAPDFFSPETFQASPVPAGVKTASNLVRNIAVALVAIVFVGGVGALSYFVIFPLLFPPKSVTPVANAPVPTPVVHQSFLVQPPGAQVNLQLKDHKYLTIATAMQSESFNQLIDGQSKEIVLSENGQQLSFPTFLSAVSPVTGALTDKGYFEDDFTALLYYDANGVWPVYVAKLKAGADAVGLVNSMKGVEGVLDLGNFYLAPPGSFGGFKDGKVNNYITRYSVGTQSGSAFNYGVLGNYFVIATNYNGLKAAVPLLGL